jgi:hypothetical protein
MRLIAASFQSVEPGDFSTAPSVSSLVPTDRIDFAAALDAGRGASIAIANKMNCGEMGDALNIARHLALCMRRSRRRAA